MKENNRSNSYKRRRSKQKEKTIIHAQAPELVCELCHQKIADVATAISYGPEQEPTHFDCVLSELSKKIPLDEHKKLVYLGSGFFGVILEKGARTFELTQRLLIEDQTNLPQWRKKVREFYHFS